MGIYPALPDAARGNFVLNDIFCRASRKQRRSALIDAVFAWADEDEGEKDETKLQRVGGAAEAFRVVIGNRGNSQRDDQQQARRTEAKTDDEQHHADTFRKGG